jgi:hypothetical protein
MLTNRHQLGKPSRLLTVFFFFILPALPAFVAGPDVAFASGAVSLPRTGQTACYDVAGWETPCAGTGQDGDIKAGISWPAPRFTMAGECITDNLTGLMWPKDANLPGGTRVWHEALDFANNLNLCGYDDWHLPNVNELDSLANPQERSIGAWLMTQGFTNLQGFYWSSTAFSSGLAWVVSMGQGGYDNLEKAMDYGVWPVRQGKESTGPASLWKTGQITSYGQGDDGDLQLGVQWPSPRFIDHGNGTVTDRLTELMWTKDTNAPGPSACNPGESKYWDVALDYIACLNKNKYLDFTDWRLPNRKEIFSLIDFGRHNPVLPLDHPFTNVKSDQQTDTYWSSTSLIYWKHYAWVVWMWGGELSIGEKGGGYKRYVWPVRGGDVQKAATLTVSKSGSGTGSVTSAPDGITCGATCAADFANGTVVTLTASPAVGSSFSGWGGACTGSGLCTITIDGTASVTATFILIPSPQLTVTKQGSGTGTVTSSPSGINCGADCSKSWPPGTVVTLTATPAASSTFSGWSGGCSGTGTCTVTINSNTVVAAAFALIPPCTYTLKPPSKAFTANGGSVTVSVTGTGQTVCPAPAVTAPGWVTTTAGLWAKNKGTVKITAPKNASSLPISGTVSIGSVSLAVSQLGTACAITKFVPTSQSFGKSSQSSSFAVEVAPQDCAWTSTVSTAAIPWLHIISGAGTGNGTVSYGIDENPGKAARSGTISVILTQNSKKKTFTVRQGNK